MKEQKRKVMMVALMSAATMFAACSKDTPGSLADPSAAVMVKSLAISGFSGGSQTVSGLEDGTYSLLFFATGEGKGYVEAGGKKTALVNSPTVLTEGCVRGIEVSGGSCTVSLNDADASRFSTMRLVKSDKPFALLKGGDLSELTYVEQNGGKFYSGSQQGDCMEILKNNGMNVARLRLYNEPGKYKYTSGGVEYELPAGIQDEADILRLAKRAKAQGMQLLLTFHYSDFWSNGETQHIPHAWQDMDAATMTKALYDFTYLFMEKMKAQGTTPEFVSLGNETQAGMLYPLGGPLSQPLDYTLVENLAAFYNAGYEAVKASSADTRVIIHLAGAGDKDTNNWYFDLMQQAGVRYDIIGSSYYPFWTGKTAREVCEWAEYITDRYDKDLIFMETAYAWSQKTHDNIDGQLSHNWPYTNLSQTGQKNFMLELTNEIKLVGNQRVLGYVYWDPIFIPAGSAGWVVGGPNIVSNSALFGFDGHALPVFDAFRNND